MVSLLHSLSPRFSQTISISANLLTSARSFGVPAKIIIVMYDANISHFLGSVSAKVLTIDDASS